MINLSHQFESHPENRRGRAASKLRLRRPYRFSRPLRGCPPSTSVLLARSTRAISLTLAHQPQQEEEAGDDDGCNASLQEGSHLHGTQIEVALKTCHRGDDAKRQATDTGETSQQQKKTFHFLPFVWKTNKTCCRTGNNGINPAARNAASTKQCLCATHPIVSESRPESSTRPHDEVPSTGARTGRSFRPDR